MLVIFDCDGVLVDSEIISARVLSECLAAEGFTLSAGQVIERYRGKSVPHCERMAAADLAGADDQTPLSDEQLARGQRFWRHMQAETLRACERDLDTVPGVEAVLEELEARGIPYCVASNGKHEKMAVTLRATGLQARFDGRIFSYEDVAQGKPAPDLFLFAAHSLGVEPSQSVVIEDSVTGVRAAKAAGMRVLGFCPPEPDGNANPLLGEMQALGAECFFAMPELLERLDKPTAVREIADG
ncbi:HAD family hydrolase [Marinimicrobium alkaliphilum]|uniref:HAD family hydrolase n=1 Tax=Marinimicrobium alkaliphilum TaxID=2202654 RepID=UPI000DB928E9|nr:HAD family hydrolase [Marinimicrobium alkaliphilum]